MTENKENASEFDALKSYKKTLELVVDELIQSRNNKVSLMGLPTGFTDIDRLIGGFEPGELIVVGARPSMGKTAFALNIAEYVAFYAEMPVVFFSLEMTSKQIVTRLLGSHQRIHLDHLKRGTLNQEEWSKVASGVTFINNSSFYIDNSPYLTLSMLRDRAISLVSEVKQIGLIIVDPIQLMTPEKEFENRYQEMAAVSRGLKLLAKELNCPVVAVSQLNRFLEQRPDKRPMLWDLRDSGTLEDDADIVIFLYRDICYNPELIGTDQERDAEAIIRKQRNGITGTVNLTFFKEYAQFRSRALSMKI